MDDYHSRIVDTELAGLLGVVPAIAVEGIKAVGKTETTRRLTRSELRLDDPGTRRTAEADPGALLGDERPVLVDEWQLVPPIWDAVRRAVDTDPGEGQYVLTGSARPVAAPTHSGAGRIVQMRMRPMTLPERDRSEPTISLGDLLTDDAASVDGRSRRDLRSYAEAVVTSGLPRLHNRPEADAQLLLDGYLEQLIQRDTEIAGRPIRQPETLRRWLRAFSAAVGTTTSMEKIRDAATAGDGATPARTTTTAYHEMLQRIWVVDELAGWAPSRRRLTRVGQAPKHHLADPALAATALGVDSQGLLSDGILFGQLFESLAAMSVRVFAQANRARVHHFRTHGGDHEVDLIIERRDGKILPIEVKLRSDIRDSDVGDLHWLRDRLPDLVLDTGVITTGQIAYRRNDGVAVIPLDLLGP